jgi:aryl-alcohol dehydrogenase-like predicted oxidoreductase
MERRTLGASGLTISAVGLGTWQLANPQWGMSDAGEALGIVRQALDAGCDLFDTAPAYAAGKSEELLGQALKSVRHAVKICTKFGSSPEGTANYAAAAIRPSLEASLRRLQTDYVDIYLIHSPPIELLDGWRAAEHYDELEKLKAEGKIRVYGVSVDLRKELKTVLETTRSGAIEILFNVFHQEPLAAFEHAQEAGVGLIVKVPLDSGWLSGKYRANSQFTGVRSRWSPAVIARRAALAEQFAALVPTGTPLTHAAIQYCLAQPGVSAVIPGAKNVEQARQNFAAAEGQLPADIVRALGALWERELRDNTLPW